MYVYNTGQLEISSFLFTALKNVSDKKY